MKPLIAVLLIASPLCAQCAGSRCRVAPSYVAPAVVAPVVVPSVTLVQPLYGASYSDGGSCDDETRDKLAKLDEKIERLTKALESAKGETKADAPAPNIDVFAVFNRSCTGCHSGDKPKDGFSFAAKDGTFRQLSKEERDKVIDRVNRTGSGVMPPPGHPKEYPALTTAEKQAVKVNLSDDAVARVEKAPQPVPTPPPAPVPPAPEPLPTFEPITFKAGDTVRLKGTSGEYRVLDLDGARVLVQDVKDLERVGYLPVRSLEKK